MDGEHVLIQFQIVGTVQETCRQNWANTTVVGNLLKISRIDQKGALHYALEMQRPDCNEINVSQTNFKQMDGRNIVFYQPYCTNKFCRFT